MMVADTQSTNTMDTIGLMELGRLAGAFSPRWLSRMAVSDGVSVVRSSGYRSRGQPDTASTAIGRRLSRLQKGGIYRAGATVPSVWDVRAT